MIIFKRLSSILCVFLGIIVIALGVGIVNESSITQIAQTKQFNHFATSYSADYASFGGDYYTYSYKASQIMVDELNDINDAMATMIDAQNLSNNTVVRGINKSIESIEKIGGFIIIAIGVGIFAFSLQYVGNAFSDPHIKKSNRRPSDSNPEM